VFSFAAGWEPGPQFPQKPIALTDRNSTTSARDQTCHRPVLELRPQRSEIEKKA
jgi:hypothetical protein